MNIATSLDNCYCAFSEGFAAGGSAPLRTEEEIPIMPVSPPDCVTGDRIFGCVPNLSPYLFPGSVVDSLSGRRLCGFPEFPELWYQQGVRLRLFLYDQAFDEHVTFPIGLCELCPWLPRKYDRVWLPVLNGDHGQLGSAPVEEDVVVKPTFYDHSFAAYNVGGFVSGFSHDVSKLGSVISANLLPAELAFLHDAAALADDSIMLLPTDIRVNICEVPFSSIVVLSDPHDMITYVFPFNVNERRFVRLQWMNKLISKLHSVPNHDFHKVLDSFGEFPMVFNASDYAIRYVKEAIERGWHDDHFEGPIGYLPDAIHTWLELYYCERYNNALAVRFVAEHPDSEASHYVSLSYDVYHGAYCSRPFFSKIDFLDKFFPSSTSSLVRCTLGRQGDFPSVYQEYLGALAHFWPGSEPVSSVVAHQVFMACGGDHTACFEVLLGVEHSPSTQIYVKDKIGIDIERQYDVDDYGK